MYTTHRRRQRSYYSSCLAHYGNVVWSQTGVSRKDSGRWSLGTVRI